MTAVTVIMDADEAKLFRALQKILEQQMKLAAGVKETGKQSRESAKEAEEAAKAKAKAEKEYQDTLNRGKALTASLRTPQEAYNAKLAEANELKEKGAISDETHQRRLAQLNQEMKVATGEAARNSAVERARLDVMQKHGVVTESARVALEKYERTLAELSARQAAGAMSAEELAVAQGHARREFERSSGLVKQQDGLVSALTSRVGGYATAAGAAALAVGAIKGAWEAVNAEQEKGKAAIDKTQETERRLRQVTTPEEFLRVRAQTEQMSVTSGVPLPDVQRVMFSAISEGFRDAVPDIIAANQIISPESAAGVAGQVPALFKGQINAMEAVTMTLKAAEQSRLDFEQIARAIPGAAEGGAIAGASPEETMAFVSVLASRFKSGDTASDRIKTLATKIGTDQGSPGMTDAEFQQKMDAEAARVDAAQKTLRSKEERVADLESQLAKAKTNQRKEEIAVQLDRAKRDVDEFDRRKLEFKTPQRTQGRASVAGLGLTGGLKKLMTMSEADLNDFLGDSSELRAAYQIAAEEIATIERSTLANIQERKNFAVGRGMLQAKIRGTKFDDRAVAVLNNRKAVQIAEQASREVKGIQGLDASTAAAQVDAFITRDGSKQLQTFNGVTGIPSWYAKLAATTGMSPEDASRTANDVFTYGTENAFNPLGKLEKAFTDFRESVADFRRASQRMSQTPQPSVTAAARGQANQAAQGGF